MTLDNMTGITKVSYTGGDLFCKSQLITCNRVKECNGVCPFEDALKHADKEMNEQHTVDHDRDWIIGCIEHDGFIHTHRFDKANQIILDALSAEADEWIPREHFDVLKKNYDMLAGLLVEEKARAIGAWIPCSERLPDVDVEVLATVDWSDVRIAWLKKDGTWETDEYILANDEILAWMPLPKPYREESEDKE